MEFMHDWYCVPGEDQEERNAHCVEQITSQIDSVLPADALERLTGWLDLTARRLKRIRRSRFDKDKRLVRQAPRYRADGSLYEIH